MDSEVCEPDMMTKMVEGMLPSFTKKINPFKLPDIMQNVPEFSAIYQNDCLMCVNGIQAYQQAN